ncbi:MAG TPA: FxLYD domain-containing protein [Methylomirabilota bacterium]|jgi:hypothetical protein
MPAVIAVLLAVAALLPAGLEAGPLQADATIDEYFRLQWRVTPGPRGPEIAGHVDNVGNLPADRMEVLVERLDTAGTVVGSSRAWVMGVVAPQQRTYFTAQVPAAPAYRVRILTFDWTTCRD